jgi:hypothetical protein
MVFSSIYGAFVIEGSHALESPSVVAFMGRRGPLARARARPRRKGLSVARRASYAAVLYKASIFAPRGGHSTLLDCSVRVSMEPSRQRLPPESGVLPYRCLFCHAQYWLSIVCFKNLRSSSLRNFFLLFVSRYLSLKRRRSLKRSIYPLLFLNRPRLLIP